MRPTRMATLQDVADMAEVSRGTASRALMGAGRVSADTRARVRAVAEQLSYVGNAGARNLRHARAGAVGLWLPRDLQFMEYYMNFTFGVVEGAQEQKTAVSVIPATLSPREVGGLHVDGFVLADVDAGDDVARAILDGARPTVASELVPPELPPPSGVVAADHIAATRRVLDRLRASGARCIGILAPNLEQMWVREVRRAAREWATSVDAEVVVTVIDEVPSAAQLTEIIRRMLTARAGLDAILCLPEGVGVGVLTALLALGRTVPDDVQLVSYSGSPSLAIVEPPIATMDLRPREAGARAGRLLLRLLDGSRSTAAGEVREWLDLPFLERGSLRPVGEVGVDLK